MGPGDDRYILVSHPQPVYTNLLLSLKATDIGPGASDTLRSTQPPTHTHLPFASRLCSRHNSWGQNGTIPILQRRKFIRKGQELGPGHTVSKRGEAQTQSRPDSIVLFTVKENGSPPEAWVPGLVVQSHALLSGVWESILKPFEAAESRASQGPVRWLNPCKSNLLAAHTPLQLSLPLPAGSISHCDFPPAQF